MNTLSRARFDAENVPLLVVRRCGQAQAIPVRMRNQTVSQLLYVGAPPQRSLWSRLVGGPWFHVAYFGALIVILVVAVNWAGGSVEVFRP